MTFKNMMIYSSREYTTKLRQYLDEFNSMNDTGLLLKIPEKENIKYPEMDFFKISTLEYLEKDQFKTFLSGLYNPQLRIKNMKIYTTSNGISDIVDMFSREENYNHKGKKIFSHKHIQKIFPEDYDYKTDRGEKIYTFKIEALRKPTLGAYSSLVDIVSENYIPRGIFEYKIKKLCPDIFNYRRAL